MQLHLRAARGSGRGTSGKLIDRLIVKLRVHIRVVNYIFETEARAKRPPASMQRRIVVGVGTIERGRGQVRGAEVCYRIRGVGSNGG